jgi:hypothetical protein
MDWAVAFWVMLTLVKSRLDPSIFRFLHAYIQVSAATALYFAAAYGSGGADPWVPRWH